MITKEDRIGRNENLPEFRVAHHGMFHESIFATKGDAVAQVASMQAFASMNSGDVAISIMFAVKIPAANVAGELLLPVFVVRPFVCPQIISPAKLELTDRACESARFLQSRRGPSSLGGLACCRLSFVSSCVLAGAWQWRK